MADVDFTARTIRVPALRTKTGQPLALPMVDMVHAMLVKRRALGNATFVFPANGRSGHLVEARQAFVEIERATGIVVSPHDLRRSS